MSYILGAVLELKDKAFTSNVKESVSATGKLKDELDKAGKSSDSFGKKLKGAGKKVAIGIAGATTAIVGMGTAAFAATRKVTSGLDQISKTSQKLGVSTDAYQKFSYWADQNGLSHESMERAVGRLNQRIGLSLQGNEKYSSALTKLGIDMKAVEAGTLSTEDAMGQAIQALSQLTNEQEKSALASELFGTKLARDLMPTLQDSSTTFDDATKALKEMGLLIDEDVINSAVELENTWTDLTAMFRTSGQKAMTNMIPFFQTVLDFAVNKMPKAQDMISRGFTYVGNAVDWVREKGQLAFNIIGNRIKDSQPAITNVRDLFAQVWDKITDIYESAKPTLKWIGEEGVPIVANAIADVIEGAINLYNFISDNWSKIEPYVLGIATAFGVWKVATITQSAVTTVMTAKQWALNVALNANPMGLVVLAIGLLIGAGISLYKNWDTIREKAIELWSTTKEKFSSIKDNIMDSLQPVMDFFSRLKDRWDSFKDSVSNFKMPSIGLPKWMGGDGLIQGSHATGLRKVPHDGYVAELHKGEAVLPKHEAERYRKGDLINNHTTNQNTTNNNETSKMENHFHIKVDAKDKSAQEFADEFVPILKARLANI